LNAFNTVLIFVCLIHQYQCLVWCRIFCRYFI